MVVWEVKGAQNLIQLVDNWTTEHIRWTRSARDRYYEINVVADVGSTHIRYYIGFQVSVQEFMEFEQRLRRSLRIWVE